MKKKLLAMALILVMMFALMPTGTHAAEAVPKKVTTAMKRAVTENGRVIVVDNANSKVYLFKDGKLKEFPMHSRRLHQPQLSLFCDQGREVHLQRGRQDLPVRCQNRLPREALRP